MTVIVFVGFANVLLSIRLSLLLRASLRARRVLSVVPQHSCLRLPSSCRTRHPLLNPTSPARSRHNLVVVPRVSKKFQESSEDEASKRGVHQVRDKKPKHPARLKFDSKLFSRGKDLQKLITEEKKAPG
jgi:hypothetical protein